MHLNLLMLWKFDDQELRPVPECTLFHLHDHKQPTCQLVHLHLFPEDSPVWCNQVLQTLHLHLRLLQLQVLLLHRQLQEFLKQMRAPDGSEVLLFVQLSQLRDDLYHQELKSRSGDLYRFPVPRPLIQRLQVS